MALVYINGNYVRRQYASISAEDRSACFGDGVYEVVLIKNGVIINEQKHQERLERSLAGLMIPAPMEWRAMRLILRRLLRVNRLLSSDTILYLSVSRGRAKRDHAFPEYTMPSLFMMVSRVSYPSVAAYEKGSAAITVEDIRWLKRDIKSISLLPNVLAKQQAVEINAKEAILIEADGTVTEGSSSNVFLLNEKKELLTHPVDRHILAGITREGVIEVAKNNNIQVKEVRFGTVELMNAYEVFVTSTTKHILPITSIDGKEVGDGKVGRVTKQLMKLYKGYISEQEKYGKYSK